MYRICLFFKLIVLLTALSSCELIDIHPYAGKLTGTLDINNKNIAAIESNFASKDTIRFAFISDSQRWYDELGDFVEHINPKDDIDFIIHGGDLADFGLTDEFLMQRDLLEKSTKPYVVLIGNHDLLANGEEIFEKVFGSPNFSFIAGKTKFLGMNTNALESNYANPVPNFSFINSELKNEQAPYNQTIAMMHARPTSEQFDNNVSNVFQYHIRQFPNLLFGLHGHEHRYMKEDVFNDGIFYIGGPNIGKRQYLVFTISPGSFTHEIHSY